MILHFLCSVLIPQILPTVSPLSVLCPFVSLQRWLNFSASWKMLVAFPSKLNSIEEWFFILSVPFWFPKSFQLLALCQSSVCPPSVLRPSLCDVGHPIGLLSVYVWCSNCVRVLLVLVFGGSRNKPNYFTTFLKNLPQVKPKALKNNCFCYLCFAPFRFPKHSQIHLKINQKSSKNH